MRDHLSQVGGHVRVALGFGTGAGAMVAHVQGYDLSRIREAFGDHAPVAPRAIEAMHDQQCRVVWGWRGIAVGGEIQHRV